MQVVNKGRFIGILPNFLAGGRIEAPDGFLAAPLASVVTHREKFAVGQPVSRLEDPMLLRGDGRYTDDFSLDGQAYAYVLRSPYAHGFIRTFDVSEAKAAPEIAAAPAASVGEPSAIAAPAPLAAPTPAKINLRLTEPANRPPRVL